MSAGEWAWGLDVKTTKVAYGLVDLTATEQIGLRWNACLLPKERDLGIRLEHMRDELIRFTGALAGHFPPAAVVIELPAGKFSSPPLTAAWAATVMACRAALPGLLIASNITPPMWKKALGLKGNCGKPETIAHAISLGYTGPVDDDDLADAVCIAQYCADQLLPQLAAAA